MAATSTLNPAIGGDTDTIYTVSGFSGGPLNVSKSNLQQDLIALIIAITGSGGGGAPSGPAGGDLGGTYPNPLVLQMEDGSGNVVIIGSAYSLVDPVSGSTSVDWSNRILNDGNDLTSVDWENRWLKDGNDLTSVDYNDYILIGNGSTALNWNNRTLINSGGVIVGFVVQNGSGWASATDTGWTANQSAGSKTVAVQNYAASGFDSTMIAALNTVSAGTGTAIATMAQQIQDLTNKLQALETALATSKIPNA